MRWPFFILLLCGVFSCVSNHGLRTQKEDVVFFGVKNKSFRLIGRFDTTSTQYARCWAPGASIEVGFTGSFLEIEVNDEVKYGSQHNYMEVIVDDLPPQRIRLKARHNVLKIADHLPPTKHRLLICKNTEASVGFVSIVGISCEAVFPISPRKRKIEFIGDSITCGNGCDDSQLTCDQGEWYDQHNAYLSFGCVLSRKLEADWQLTAVSGIGITRSCCGSRTTMPQIVDRIDLSKKGKKWDLRSDQPDLIVVTLGQNDGMQDSAVFCATYIQFLKTIRKRCPSSKFICCASPMANAELKSVMKNYVYSIADEMNQLGDNNVFAYSFKGMYRSGYQFHPTAGEHQSIANELEVFVRKTMGWFKD